MNTGILCLGTRPDASTWQKGCYDLGFKVPLPIKQSNQVTFDASKDLAGPLTIAAAATDSSTNGRLVVIGDSDFANDTYFDQYANSDMIANSVDWAAGQENIINLTAKQPISRTLNLPNSVLMVILAISSVCILPGLVLAGGVASWLMRRARG